MKDPIVSRIIDLLIDLCTDAFSGIQGKFQLFNIKRRLKKQIFNEILSKYGDRVFYNDLDHFLTDNDVICNVIRNCCDVSVFHYKSKSQTIDYYVQLFVEQHPRYSRYHYEIRTLLQRYFEVIYLALNKSNNNETRVICNVAKELAHGLLDELQDIKSAVTAQYSTNFFFITSRFNRYHGELGEKKQYFLTALSEQTIRQELRKDGIVVDIPRHYYMLFSNPFFLSVGKSVLKQSTNRDIFNRSRLFEELFQKLYGGISQQGQFAGRAPLTYHDAQTILGNFAYHTFSHYLNQTNTVLSEHILPGPDMPIPARGSCFTWDCYSKEQKERRIALFFYYHEISYLSMVEYNFPILKKYFQRYNDAPYQVVVEVDHNEEANPHDFTSEPSIQYHYIASPTEDIPMPVIRQTREKIFFDYDQIVKDIQESYLKQGRTANHITTTRTGFTFTTTSRRTGGDDPLSDYVYSSIKESLEDVFGSMR